MATREELEAELARRARARELEGEFARRAATKAPAVPASQLRPRRPAPDPLAGLTLGGGPVPDRAGDGPARVGRSGQGRPRREADRRHAGA